MRSVIISCILYYLRWLAIAALKVHKPFIVGIAGSAGKSSARNAVYAVLKDHFKVKMIAGNSETGIPLGLLGYKPEGYRPIDWVLLLVKAPFGIGYLRGTTHIIVEMGIDDPYPPKNMEYLLSFIKPNIAVSLNASATHTYQFEKLLPKTQMPEEERNEFLVNAIAQEDTKIITESDCLTAIYNADDRYILSAISDNLLHQPTQYTFGKSSDNTISFTGYKPGIHSTEFKYRLKDKSLTLHVNNFLVPQVYQETIAAALLVGYSLDVSTESMLQGLEHNFQLPSGRSSLFEGVHDSTIIDSTYNSSRRSVMSFLDLVQSLSHTTKRAVVFLCGDMNELGTESEIEHTALVPLIQEAADYVYCVGPETQKYIYPLLETKKNIKEVKWFETAIHAGEYLQQNLPSESIVLAKGSQNRVFLEEAVKMILINDNDKKKLCRQESYWIDIKNTYFRGKGTSIPSKNT